MRRGVHVQVRSRLPPGRRGVRRADASARRARADGRTSVGVRGRGGRDPVRVGDVRGRRVLRRMFVGRRVRSG
ncbi:hypothetical protein DB32_006992 [Sandaracinus amylolyticus]|uniref:Uncharacterized protein n=1 Tax=Sandaracinus amylolyticus TaxID=927083 RepID=A0A0F6W824_9BACT|nr:hypothetical protein DB32_006992 [Sandaracinus amylolyticus]